MPVLGMTGRWPGFVPAAVAFAVTLAVTWLIEAAARSGETGGPIGGLVLLVLLPAPLLLAVMWGGAVLTARPTALVVAGAAAWFGATVALFAFDAVWSLGGQVAGGTLAGWALVRRWRLDAAIIVVSLALLPPLIWSGVEMSPDEQIDALSREMLKAAEERMPQAADATQRERALATERENIARVSAAAKKMYPFFVGLGILGQAIIILAGLWLLARAVGAESSPWRLPPFPRWRLPFYVVWTVIAGLGLFLTRRSPLCDAGLNLALLGALVLSIQGIAVQVFVTNRMLSPVGRVVYWAVMGMFFAPLVVVSGVVLGLADQWWDIRRLDAPPASEGPQNDAGDDGDDAPTDRN